MLDRLDFWLTIFTIAAAVYFLGWKDVVEPRVRWAMQRWRTLSRSEQADGRSEPVQSMGEPPEPLAVLPRLNHPEPSKPGEIEPALESLQLNRLSRIAEIALLAVQRNDDGNYRHSANDITRFMGGTAADAKKQIAEIRATKPEREPKPEERVTRPPKGWANPA